MIKNLVESIRDDSEDKLNFSIGLEVVETIIGMVLGSLVTSSIAQIAILIGGIYALLSTSSVILDYYYEVINDRVNEQDKVTQVFEVHELNKKIKRKKKKNRKLLLKAILKFTAIGLLGSIVLNSALLMLVVGGITGYSYYKTLSKYIDESIEISILEGYEKFIKDNIGDAEVLIVGTKENVEKFEKEYNLSNDKRNSYKFVAENNNSFTTEDRFPSYSSDKKDIKTRVKKLY